MVSPLLNVITRQPFLLPEAVNSNVSCPRFKGDRGKHMFRSSGRLCLLGVAASAVFLLARLRPEAQAPPSPVPAGGEQMDEEFAAFVKENTTKPEFLSPLVDHLPKKAGVPTPKDILGHYIGAPKR